MNEYIATFYSHFGALLYFRALEKRGIAARLMPVPREVSAACGTCVCYAHAEAVDLEECELDGVYVKADDGLNCVLKK